MRRGFSTHPQVGRIIIIIALLIVQLQSAFAAPQSLNPNFFGTWKGTAPIRQLCSGGGQDRSGLGPIALSIERPKIEPSKNYTVILRANWGCFAEMTIPGFVFDDEFWAAADDRMTFMRLKLERNGTVSGVFRFDLNGQSLKMDFENLKK